MSVLKIKNKNGEWESVNAIQGPQGLKGETGEQGPVGPKGETGPQGILGIQGPQGDSYILTEADKTEIAGIVEAQLDSLIDEKLGGIENGSY